ncbi:hypothetical protein ACN28S_30625 [Cystobacter fuscus]
MEQNGSTLKPSGILGDKHASEERVPGLLRLFAAGTAMAVALPLKDGELELGRGSPRWARRRIPGCPAAMRGSSSMDGASG